MQWPWHWGEWIRNASVYFDHEKVANFASAAKPPSEPAAKASRGMGNTHAHGRGLSGRIPLYPDPSVGSIDLIAALRAISPNDIERMQRVIAEHAHCMHYAVPSASAPAGARGAHSGEGDGIGGGGRGATAGTGVARSRQRHSSQHGHDVHVSHRTSHAVGGADGAFEITLRGSWMLGEALLRSAQSLLHGPERHTLLTHAPGAPTESKSKALASDTQLTPVTNLIRFGSAVGVWDLEPWKRRQLR